MLNINCDKKRISSIIFQSDLKKFVFFKFKNQVRNSRDEFVNCFTNRLYTTLASKKRIAFDEKKSSVAKTFTHHI